MKFDVAIIGAGAAGLAAARALSGAGKRICLIEARPRAGGRVSTLHIPDLPVPIELGAEFLHGEAPASFDIVDAAALAVCELPDDHWWSKDGQITEIRDFWGQIDRVRARIGRLKRDVSFAEFLRTQRAISPRLRELSCMFVEGYHAAHAGRMSALALQTSDEEQSENRQFRLAGGYDAVLEWLRAGIDPQRSELRFGTVANRVQWSKGSVSIECDTATIHARAAVLTIPIGVWKAGTLAFDPPLREKERALAKLEAGHVVKIAFRFRERFWEDVNFVHARDRFMPTWWTTAPIRSPILTGWAGGHAADALLAERPAMIDRALDSMSGAFGVPRRRLDALLAGTWTHDWQSDPFSRGAYTYAAVGGSGAHDELARPLKDTLFFAGEATSSDETGTVAGAIETGLRAARRISSVL
ncbi:MAG TPA: NAD(P)/FAD-dependent oxidoreductase [Thermoanaerobaculia bacterium]|nr:NAD(P)/FAD-dependent oxidoreductase [Thermoanaerobaculia bacterium]